MNKIICLDYDGSYTEFPELFDMIISFCKSKGHTVIIATMRYPHEEDDGLKEIRKKGVDIYYTCRGAKLHYLKNIGIKPDLWIDDNPHFLFENG